MRFCTYILLIALTLQSFYRSIMTVEYQIHLPEYLAKCINQDRPQLHCDGQCILMKKVREKEKEEAKKNLIVYEYSSLYVHNVSTAFAIQRPKEQMVQNHFPPYLVDYTFNHNTTIFHPPIG